MHANEKLNGANYDLWHLKVKLLMNNRDMIELLTASMPAPAYKDEHGKKRLLLVSSTKRA